jgi:transcriptional regulator with XRE-family HTH domain
MDAKERIGLNLQRLRRAHKLSQEELADIAGLHQTYVSGIERGIRNPTITVIYRIADALGVEPEELVTRKP